MLWPYIIDELDTLLTLIPEDPSFLVILIFTWCSYLLQRISCPSNSLSQTPLINRRATWSSFLKLSYISNISPPSFIQYVQKLLYLILILVFKKNPWNFFVQLFIAFSLLSIDANSSPFSQNHFFESRVGHFLCYLHLKTRHTTTIFTNLYWELFTNPINKEKL